MGPRLSRTSTVFVDRGLLCNVVIQRSDFCNQHLILRVFICEVFAVLNFLQGFLEKDDFKLIQHSPLSTCSLMSSSLGI